MNTACHAELDRTHALPETESRHVAASRWTRARLAWLVMVFLLLSLVIASLSAAAQPVSVLLLILAAGACLVAGERSVRRPRLQTSMEFYGLVEMKDKWLA